MTKYLVFDVDSRFTRVVLADGSGISLRVESATSIELSGSEIADLNEVAGQIARHVDLHRGSKVAGVALLSGPDVQSRLMRLPPATADELVDMVTLTSTTEFAAGDDSSVLDFCTLSGDASTPHLVLAARGQRSAIDDARCICETLRVPLAHVLPRGGALAWLAGQCLKGCHLLAMPHSGGLELVVSDNGKPVLMRSVTLPSEGHEGGLEASDVAIELRRTLAGIPADATGGGVQSIRWVTTGAAAAGLIAGLRQRLNTSIEPLELGAAWPQLELPIKLPTDEAIAILVAAAGSVSAGSAELDFVNPSRRALRPSQRRTQVLALTAAALLVGFLGWMLWQRGAVLQSEIAELQRTGADTRNKVEQLAEIRTEATAVEQWLATDVNWLSELERLTLQLRPKELSDKEFVADRDVMLTDLTAQRRAGALSRGGQLMVTGLARQSEALAALEEQVRDEEHGVAPLTVTRDLSRVPYQWTFRSAIDVQPKAQ